MHIHLRHILGIGAMATLAFSFTGCAKKDLGNRVVKLCNEKEHMTGGGVFRASGNATSPNMSMAEEMALSQARNTLASSISVRIKSITDRSMNQAEAGSGATYSGVGEQFVRQIVDQELTGAVIICSEVTKEKESSQFRAWVAIELSGTKIAEKYINRISELPDEDELKARFMHDKQFEKWKDEFLPE